MAIEYPMGHRGRREESLPLLMDKARKNIRSQYDHERTEKLMQLFANPNFLFQPIDCLFE
jgi:2-methylcitrate dehydratase PrpD